MDVLTVFDPCMHDFLAIAARAEEVSLKCNVAMLKGYHRKLATIRIPTVAAHYNYHSTEEVGKEACVRRTSLKSPCVIPWAI